MNRPDDVREVNGTQVIRKENSHGVKKDYVRVSIGTTVLEVRRRLENPITDRKEDLTRLSDNGYLKHFLACWHGLNRESLIDLSEGGPFVFDHEHWDIDEQDDQVVIVDSDKREVIADD